MSERLLEFVVGVLMVLILLPIHESAHAFVANRLGDPTARLLGRLTLNPVKHIDPIGAILLLTVHFGWGKPVPVDVRYFKNPKRDMALTAVAGPLSNLVVALALVVLYKLCIVAVAVAGASTALLEVAGVVVYILQSLAVTSIYLAVFNMLPVPPLDGSRLLEYLIPGGYYARIAPYQRWITAALMALLLFTEVLTKPMSMLSLLMFRFLDFITQPIQMLGMLLAR